MEIRDNLLSVGFTSDEINAYEYIINNGGKITPMWLQRYGFNIEQSKRIIYLHKFINSNIDLNSEENLIKHVTKINNTSKKEARQRVYINNISNREIRKNYSKEELIKRLRLTYGKTRRLTVSDLAISNIRNVPRVAVVSGVDIEPFTIWNSNNYKGKDALYKVIDVSAGRILIETKRKPKLAYGSTKELKGILEIKGVKQSGEVVVAFDKKVCRLCNRFIIIASTRRPEFHLGMFEIICFEGTKLYVYATSVGTKEKVSYSGGNQRIYGYGIFNQDIRQKLENIAKKIFNSVKGVYSEYLDKNIEYRVVPKEKTDDIDYSEY